MALHILYKQLLLGLSELILWYFQLQRLIEKWPISSQNKKKDSSDNIFRKKMHSLSIAMLYVCVWFVSPWHLFTPILLSCSYNMKAQHLCMQVEYSVNLLSLMTVMESFGKCNHHLPERIVNIIKLHQPPMLFVLEVLTAWVDVFSTRQKYMKFVYPCMCARICDRGGLILLLSFCMCYWCTYIINCFTISYKIKKARCIIYIDFWFKKTRLTLTRDALLD